MSKVASCKRKLKTRTVTEKYKILQEVKKGESSASMSKKYGVRKQKLSGWLKEKSKIYSEVKKNKTSVKRVRMLLSPHEDLDRACYLWLLNPRHQSILCQEPFSRLKLCILQKNVGVTVFMKTLEDSYWIRQIVISVFSTYDTHYFRGVVFILLPVLNFQCACYFNICYLFL